MDRGSETHIAVGKTFTSGLVFFTFVQSFSYQTWKVLLSIQLISVYRLAPLSEQNILNNRDIYCEVN